MRTSLHTLLVASGASLVASKPLHIADVEERQVLDTPTIFGITQTSTGLKIIPTNVDPPCTISASITADDTCGDLAARYRIMLPADDRSYSADSDTCRDIMSGLRICLPLSTDSKNTTTSGSVSQMLTLPPHNTSRRSGFGSAIVSPLVTTSTGNLGTATSLPDTPGLTYFPTTCRIDTSTDTSYGYSSVTAIQITTVTTVVLSGTLTDVELIYHTRIFTYTTTSTVPTFTALANVANLSLTNVFTVQKSSSHPSTTPLGDKSSSCKGVAAPGPTQEGINPRCVKWYVVEEGDSCSSIAEKNGISEDDFDDWNPYVGGPDCDTLFAGDAVCVAVCGGNVQTQASMANSGPAGIFSHSFSITGFVGSTRKSSASSSSILRTSDSLLTASSSYSLSLTDSILPSSYSHSTITPSRTSTPTKGSSTLSIRSSNTLTSRISSLSTLTTTTSSSSTLTSSTSFLTSLTSSSVTSSLSSIFASTTSIATSAAAISPGIAYKLYTGNGSTAAGWPAESQWFDFDALFENNTPHMTAQCAAYNVPLNSDAENADTKTAILAISALTDVDPRFILAIIMQESSSCVRAPSTFGSVSNTGLMQSHDGRGSCNNGTVVQTPCPYSEIYQMVLDGTNGTYTNPLTAGDGGDGLRQALAEQEENWFGGSQAYFRAARMYNGGSVTDLNLGLGCCTACYVSDVANRLTGWYGWVSGCTASTTD